ncbi:MAG: hypothetical protein QOF02_2526 [Blastocatellia bacterium]|jgi:hypothetical protein|nr:hypothetical protein [Blastocatellia bacterium]
MQGETGVITITAAFIGLAGVIIGALLKLFSDELKVFLTGKSKGSRDFLGQWKCAWAYVDGGNASKELLDVVEIKKAAGDKIFATGTNVNGVYEMAGSIKNNDIILFSYSAEKLFNSLGGVVILVANKRRTKMQGHWHEYVDDGTFVGGTTTWEKCQ